MRFSPQDSSSEQNNKDNGRSILQVPSLASNGGLDQEEKKLDSPSNSPAYHWGGSPQMPPHHLQQHHHQYHGQLMMNGVTAVGGHRPDAWNFHPADRSPPWIQHHHHPAIPYSPIRVRSGRGAGRMTADLPPSEASSRPSFSVSNRGKPRRGTSLASCGSRGRTSSPEVKPTAVRTTDVVKSPPTSRQVLKRKLPMTTRKEPVESVERTAPDEESSGDEN
jgi:hypothetical protein